MNAIRFLDTNILLYALDLDAGPKRQTAFRVIVTGWQIPGAECLSMSVAEKAVSPFG